MIKRKKDLEKEKEDEEDLDINIKEVEDSSGTWIIEGKTDDDILDFLETKANKHISLTNPNKSEKRKYEESFEYDDEGRMIIEEEDEEIGDDLQLEDSEDEEIEKPRKKLKLSETKKLCLKFKKEKKNL